MAPKSDTVHVVVDLQCAGIGVDDLVEEISSLQLQLADTKRALVASDALAAEAVEVATRYQQNGDRMAEMLASTVMQLEEATKRMAWYRRMLGGRVDGLIIELVRQHRLNGVW